MALHGLTERCEEPLSDDDLRLGLSGNLCRCTGYEQIMEAGRSLQPADMSSAAERFDTKSMLTEFSKHSGPVLVNAQPAGETNGALSGTRAPEMFLPSTLSEVLQRRAERPESTLVAGATDLGVQHNHGKIAPTDIIYTQGVAEFDQLTIENNELVIGAAVSWSRIESYIEARVPEYHQILTRFGSPQVRHAGTLIGNLANASPIADSIPFHYVAGSTLELASASGQRQVPIEEFYLGYKKLDLRPDEVIVSVRTLLPMDSQRLRLYKISKRRDMDISTVTAAFLIEVENETVTNARIATGGVAPTVVRVPKAEDSLHGKPLTLATMQEAGRIARDEITPISDVRGSAEYRLQLVENLFAKCYYDLSCSPETVKA